MDSHAAPPGLLSMEEYLELEASSHVRHEYVGGMVYALAGGSDRHNRIAINMVRRLADAADHTPCRVYMADMKLIVADISYYPDLMVCCEEPDSDNPTFRHDPCLLVEVVSPGTASIDRREKLLVYRELPTLRAYFIVDQDTQRVERHFRGDDGVWQRADHVTDGTVPVPCLDTELALADIYRGL